MWFADQNREQFLHMLQLEALSSDAGSFERIDEIGSEPPSGTIRLIWKHEPQRSILPALLVLPEGDKRDFFAWSTTYLGGWRPISGLFRVISGHELRFVLEAKHNHERAWEYRNAVLGIILGEAAVRRMSERSAVRESGSLFAECIATCSFVLGRAMYLGSRDFANVIQNWHRSHVVTRYALYERDLPSLLGPWSVLAEVGGFPTRASCGTRDVSQAVVAICHALHKHDEVDAAAVATLTQDWPELERALRDMDGARERRVNAFDLAARVVGERRPEIARNSDNRSGFAC